MRSAGAIRAAKSYERRKNSPEYKEQAKLRSLQWRTNSPEKYKQTYMRFVKKRTKAHDDAVAPILAKQKGKCAICKTSTPTRRKVWNLDHDHTSGRPRGVLCDSCNLGLGHFGDNPDVLQNAAKYVRRYANGRGR